jgi:hypothetical protein
MPSVRRRHRGEAAQDEEGDTTSNLLLKYSDATLATYDETLETCI